jgi:hypothetical protein
MKDGKDKEKLISISDLENLSFKNLFFVMDHFILNHKSFSLLPIITKNR